MKKKQKVYLRADASLKIGFGHFIRTLALAEILKDRFECVYFTVNPTKYQIEQVEKVCKCVVLEEDSKFESFLSYLSGEEIVWLDNYFFTSEYQKRIVYIGCKLVCIGSNDKHYYAHAVINYIKNASEFSAEKYTTFCTGLQWCLLRKEFISLQCCMGGRDEKSIVISIGGTDQFGITERIINTLNFYRNRYVVHIIATSEFGKERMKKLQRDNVVFHINVVPEEIIQLFSTSLFAIVSASTIAQEALACGIKVFAGYYVDNQKEFYTYLENHKYIKPLGDMMDIEFEKTLYREISSSNDSDISDYAYLFKNTDVRYRALFKSLSCR